MQMMGSPFMEPWLVAMTVWLSGCCLEWSLVNLPELYVQRAVLGGESVGVKHRTLEL